MQHSQNVHRNNRVIIRGLLEFQGDLAYFTPDTILAAYDSYHTGARCFSHHGFNDLLPLFGVAVQGLITAPNSAYFHSKKKIVKYHRTKSLNISKNIQRCTSSKKIDKFISKTENIPHPWPAQRCLLITNISMAQCKSAVFPLLTQWKYWSLALTPRVMALFFADNCWVLVSVVTKRHQLDCTYILHSSKALP